MKEDASAVRACAKPLLKSISTSASAVLTRHLPSLSVDDFVSAPLHSPPDPKQYQHLFVRSTAPVSIVHTAQADVWSMGAFACDSVQTGAAVSEQEQEGRLLKSALLQHHCIGALHDTQKRACIHRLLRDVLNSQSPFSWWEKTRVLSEIRYIAEEMHIEDVMEVLFLKEWRVVSANLFSPVLDNALSCASHFSPLLVTARLRTLLGLSRSAASTRIPYVRRLWELLFSAITEAPSLRHQEGLIEVATAFRAAVSSFAIGMLAAAWLRGKKT